MTLIFCLFLFSCICLSVSPLLLSFSCRHRITYMSELRADANPFDVGVLGNLKYMFLSRRPVEWEQLYRLYLAKDDAASGDGLRPRGQDFPMLA